MEDKTIELKNDILDGTMRVYSRMGMKFTMDDLAKELHISKKTIYKVYTDKESLMTNMAIRCFDEVKKLQMEIYARDDLNISEKLKALLSAMPSNFDGIDFSLLYELRDKYPEVYSEVEHRLESGWELTFDIINKGIRQGVFKPFSYQIFKLMYTNTLESFFKYDFLSGNGMTYQEGLNNVADILINGIMNNNQ